MTRLNMMSIDTPPILRNKDYEADTAFSPGNLLREARRQKALKPGTVPDVCILDPDGDIVRRLEAGKRAKRDHSWACYHTELYRFHNDAVEMGIVGCAVGAPFAVLVAEELFECGCRLLISMTSAGQLQFTPNPPYFVVIDRALRDEGTSYHYQPPAAFSYADMALVEPLALALKSMDVPVVVGPTWTTDAPFRETQSAIDEMRNEGLLAVEMEAAALYAFAQARGKRALCFAHVTNQMGRVHGDFEKGEADGTTDALRIIRIAAECLRGVGHSSKK